MMAFLFLLLAVSGILSWLGQRRYAMCSLILLLVLSILMFAHHMTSSLTLQL